MVGLMFHYFSFLSGMVTNLIIVCTLLIPLSALGILALKLFIHRKANVHRITHGQTTVAFFHPYCNAGGGGERVLWCAIQAIQSHYPGVHCLIYTGDTDATPEEIVGKAEDRFNISLHKPVEFIYLTKRKWVEAEMYPYFTLLGQSMGSMYLGLEALLKFSPNIYIDTMGYAFTIPLFRYLGGCRVACYVHYPTISTDMLESVTRRTTSVNNSGFISRSPFLSAAKVLYYRLFAALYGINGKCCEVIMVNSSWTQGHIIKLWNCPSITFRVYPPCDISDLTEIELDNDDQKRTNTIVSVAQFRPEKDHPLQLEAFAQLLADADECRKSVRLVLIGGCRDVKDEERVAALKELACSLKIQDQVDFKLNIPFHEMKQQLQSGTIGLHTMLNEHFGIGVVECMAAGLVMVANDSGGPKMDIVTDFEDSPTGFLAKTAAEYAEKMLLILKMSPQQRLQIKISARKSVHRFDEKVFTDGFISATKLFFLNL